MKVVMSFRYTVPHCKRFYQYPNSSLPAPPILSSHSFTIPLGQLSEQILLLNIVVR